MGRFVLFGTGVFLGLSKINVSIKAVFWDLGGVIVRTEDRSRRERWEKQLGLGPRELDRIIFAGDMGRKAALGEVNADEVWEWTGARLDLNEEQSQQLERDFWQGDDLDTELVAYIRGLKDTLKIGLISNAWHELRGMIEQEWNIAEAFDDLVISAEVGFVKPDPEIYHLALDRMRVEPDQALFVDDFEMNIVAAVDLGMSAVRFENPRQVMEAVDRLVRT